MVTDAIAQKGLKGLAVGGTERDLQSRTAGLTWSQDLGQTWIWKAAREKLPESVRDQGAGHLPRRPAGWGDAVWASPPPWRR